MEPLTIFGLAVGIVQLVDFSARLLREAHEIHHSSTGHKSEHVELHRIAETLRRMCDELSGNPAETQRSVGVVGQDVSDISASAKKVAEQLITAIGELRLDDRQRRRWRSFRQALATLWHKDKIESLQARLKALREQLQASMVTHINIGQARILKDLDNLRKDFERMHSQREQSVESLIHETRRIALASLDGTCINAVEKALETVQKSRDTLRRERAILDSLRHEAMFDRYHTITEAHRKTFDWIFVPEAFPASDPRSKIAFKQWLLSGTGIFWVAGKPGSGKSTLMRHLCDCQQTERLLKAWAGHARLATAAFYFWMAGTELQRSQRGLLRQLLFEILREHPDCIRTICSERWATGTSNATDWTLDQLHHCFNRLQGITSHTKLCIFLDGLDEYGGDHFELINIIIQVSEITNIKLCVSSREWPVFNDAFGAYAERKLHLQDLTHEDIREFSRDKLEEAPQFDQFRLRRWDYMNFVEEIVRKAQGVFLWVFLVVRSLRDGLINGDNPDFLRKRLDELPSDLEEFFDKLIKSVDRVYQRQMAVAFRIACHAPDPINLVTYWLLDEDPGGDDILQNLRTPNIIQMEEEMSRRLYGRYKGLLEAVGDIERRKVSFLHRTVRDYLHTKSAADLFAFPDLNPHLRACRAFASYIALFGLKGRYRAVSLEYFMIFARWAEVQKETFDYRLVGEMRRLAHRSFLNDTIFLKEAVRYGYISGLQHLHSHDPVTFQQHRPMMIRTALDPQTRKAADIFGVQSATATLGWLLGEGGPDIIQLNGAELLVQFLLYDQYRSDQSTDMNQWRDTVAMLLEGGADLNKAFEDSRLMHSLPWIGSEWRTFYKHLVLSACIDCKGPDSVDECLQVRASVKMSLDRLLDAYSTLMEHGLDPNRPLKKKSIWEIWLWYICELQDSHMIFFAECGKAVEVFLAHGANPHAKIYFQGPKGKALTGRAGQGWLSVRDIITHYFEPAHILLPTLEGAIERWG